MLCKLHSVYKVIHCIHWVSNYYTLYSKRPIFRVQSGKKLYQAEKNYTDTACGVCDKYEVWEGLVFNTVKDFLISVLGRVDDKSFRTRIVSMIVRFFQTAKKNLLSAFLMKTLFALKSEPKLKFVSVFQKTEIYNMCQMSVALTDKNF